MPTNFAPKDPSNPYADYTVEQTSTSFSPATSSPATSVAQYEYSNLGVGLLGHALTLRAARLRDDGAVADPLDPLE